MPRNHIATGVGNNRRRGLGATTARSVVIMPQLIAGVPVPRFVKIAAMMNRETDVSES
jgi:hypothetical protein